MSFVRLFGGLSGICVGELSAIQSAGGVQRRPCGHVEKACRVVLAAGYYDAGEWVKFATR